MGRPNDVQPLYVNCEYDLILYLWGTTDYHRDVLAICITTVYSIIHKRRNAYNK